jgi:predicted transport protein
MSNEGFFHLQAQARRLVVPMRLVAELFGYLHLDPAKVLPMPPNGQDFSKKGHWGTGDLELSLSSQVDLDSAKPLILMAYEGRAPAPGAGP